MAAPGTFLEYGIYSPLHNPLIAFLQHSIYIPIHFSFLFLQACDVLLFDSLIKTRYRNQITLARFNQMSISFVADRK